jgi:Arc/MetJ family transcription regulator
MTKRLVDIDDELLSSAQRVSGDATIKATVHQALTLFVAEHRRKEADLRQRWAALGDAFDDLQDPDVMRRAWR